MPILREELSSYPPDLFDGFDQGDRLWWAVYTKARQEKALARELLQQSVPFYLPQIPKTALRRGRKFKSLIPLFQGYVFMLGTPDERRTALTTNRVSRVLDVADGGQLFHDLKQVRKLIESNAPLSVESRLDVGRRVRVKSGSLMGLEGTVQSRRGESRLVVAVQFLQQGVSMVIDDFNLEPLD